MNIVIVDIALYGVASWVDDHRCVVRMVHDACFFMDDLSSRNMIHFNHL